MDGKEIIYLQIHRLGRDEENPKTYHIENKYVDALLEAVGKETEDLQ